MEPSGADGDALRWQLTQRGFTVWRIAPKRVHDAAEVYDGVPSLHDAKAAYLIGRLHWEGVSQPSREADAARRALLAQASLVELCKARHQAGANRLEAQLSRHWPEVLRVLGYKSLTLARLLAQYGDAAHLAAGVAGARALMRRQRAQRLESGAHRGGVGQCELTITKRGPGVARHYLYFAALRLIWRDPKIRRWYQARIQRPGAMRGKSVVAVMRKLALGLWHVARGQRFEVDKLFDCKAPASAA